MDGLPFIRWAAHLPTSQRILQFASPVSYTRVSKMQETRAQIHCILLVDFHLRMNTCHKKKTHLEMRMTDRDFVPLMLRLLKWLGKTLFFPCFGPWRALAMPMCTIYRSPQSFFPLTSLRTENGKPDYVLTLFLKPSLLASTHCFYSNKGSHSLSQKG